MNTKQIAEQIFEIFSLKENEELSNEQKKVMIENIIVKVYCKGRISGHNRGVYICQNALKGLENTKQ